MTTLPERGRKATRQRRCKCPFCAKQRSVPPNFRILDSGSRESTIPRLNLLPDFPGRKLLYRPLDEKKKEIRVIVLLTAEERTAPLRCFLKTISLLDVGKDNMRIKQPYEAISYYWGSVADPEKIYVFGGSHEDDILGFQVPITTNLAGALREFRAMTTSKSESTVLWTDALSINQIDAHERSQQVIMMRDIYAAAIAVRVWLGESDSVAELGLRNLYGLAKYQHANAFHQHERLSAVEYDPEVIRPVDDALKKGATNDNLEEWLVPVISLAGLEYWRRGWTVQETCVNESTFLHHGHTYCGLINWETLFAFFGSLFVKLSNFNNSFSQRIVPSWGSLITFAGALTRLGRLQKAWHLPGYRSDKKEFLLAVRFSFGHNGMQTSDPRDLIYALLGVMPAFASLGIRPNYHMSVEDVFATTTVAILQGCQSWPLDLVCQCLGAPSLPSWAFDFSSITERYPWVPIYQNHHKADAEAQFRTKQWSPHCLATAGIVVDEVEAVSSVYAIGLHRQSVEFHGNRLVLMLNSLTSGCERLLRIGQDELRVSYWRTACGGMVGGKRFGQSHEEICSQIATETREQEDEPTDIAWTAILNALYKNVDSTRLIITRKGYLGLAPLNTTIGDHIAIVATCCVPFILRKVEHQDVTGDAYIIVGPCYIDGIMDGEAVQDEAEKRFGDRTATQRVFDESDLYLV